MNLKYQVLVCTLILGTGCLDALSQSTNRVPEAMMTIKVTDEVGAALTGMPVHVWLDDSNVLDGESDSNGLCVAKGKCSTIDPPIRIVKAGYYTTSIRCRFTNLLDKTDFQWQPWNPTVTAIVRRVVNPIPMYAKQVETKIPHTNEWFGYDLMKGDWVAPRGSGAISDLIFKVDGYWRDYRNNDSTLTLKFQNPKDGIIPVAYPVMFGMPSGSEFFMPREAPLDGYESILIKKREQYKDHDYKTFTERKGYVFRIRSITDDRGIIIGAYYGAMLRGMEFGGAGEEPSYLQFTYYLNPTSNDRNLEFDPKRNLSTNLKPGEQVTDP